MVSLALRNRLKNLQFCVTSDFFVCEQSIEQYGQDSSLRFLLADFFHKFRVMYVYSLERDKKSRQVS